MKVAILDDWFDTLRGLPCFGLLAGHDVTVLTAHVPDPAALAARLRGTEALCLFRERTPVGPALLDRLPDLKLISMRGVYPHVDVAACTARGVAFCSSTASDRPSWSTAELTWALILAAMRGLPAQMASLKAGRWQAGVGRSVRGRRLGVWGCGRIGRAVAATGRAMGMEVFVWGSEASRAAAVADGHAAATSRGGLRGVGRADPAPAPRPADPRHDRAGGPRPHGAALADREHRARRTFRPRRAAGGAGGRPGMAALDVFEGEPVTDPAHPLVTHPAVIATPHIGFVTEEELDHQFAEIFRQVNAFAEGKPLNLVNPAA